MRRRRHSDRLLERKRSRKKKSRWRKVRLLVAANQRARERSLARPWPMAGHIIRLLTANGWQSAENAGGVVRVVVPKVFSCAEQPEQVVRTIKSVAGVALMPNVREVFFDHSALVDYDLAAEAVLDVLSREVVRERRRKSAKNVSLRGIFPQDENACRFIRAIGISRHLQIKSAELSTEEQAKLVVFEKHRRSGPTPSGITYSTYKGQVVQEFVDHINRCLGTVRRRLTPGGRQRLCEYAGEVIDNVDQHAGSNHWFIAGYLDTTLTPPMCELAIFNFGNTFAESFQGLPKDSFAWRQVAPYVDLHRRKGWFSGNWTEDDLLTLVALQGGISSKVLSDQDIRGQGTVDLIRFFQDVHSECDRVLEPKMAIVSGATHIVFDGSYKLGMDTTGRWTIAFNGDNSLAVPPDRKCIHHLDGVFFPGTIVSIRFALSSTGATEAASKN